MNEDIELNAMVKNALERGVSFSPAILDTLERAAKAQRRDERGRRFFAVASFLSAAVVACVLWFGVTSSRQADEASLEEVIHLLAGLDEVTISVSSDAAAADLLLAWQDAPAGRALADNR